jgi:hypothetical protein
MKGFFLVVPFVVEGSKIKSRETSAWAYFVKYNISRIKSPQCEIYGNENDETVRAYTKIIFPPLYDVRPIVSII